MNWNLFMERTFFEKRKKEVLFNEKATFLMDVAFFILKGVYDDKIF